MQGNIKLLVYLMCIAAMAGFDVFTAYRMAGAGKAMPEFDVIDYGQEDYAFGNTEKMPAIEIYMKNKIGVSH